MLTYTNTHNTINTVNTEEGVLFLISLQGKESIYEQIKSQIEKFINAGILKPGDKLPSVRSLANDLGINPNTVMKAYQELEYSGYIYTLNKKGVFVSKDLNVNSEQLEDVKHMLTALKSSGIKKDHLHELVDEVYREENNA